MAAFFPTVLLIRKRATERGLGAFDVSGIDQLPLKNCALALFEIPMPPLEADTLLLILFGLGKFAFGHAELAVGL